MTDELEPPKSAQFLASAPKVALYQPAAETHLPIRWMDWNRIKNLVKAAKPDESVISPAGFFWAGVAISGILGWLPWLAAYDDLPEKLQKKYAWISSVFVIVSVTAAGLFAYLCWRHKRDTRQSRCQHDAIDKDMTAIERMYYPPE